MQKLKKGLGKQVLQWRQAYVIVLGVLPLKNTANKNLYTSDTRFNECGCQTPFVH